MTNIALYYKHRCDTVAASNPDPGLWYEQIWAFLKGQSKYDNTLYTYFDVLTLIMKQIGPPWKNYTDPDVAKDMDTVLGYNEPNRPDQSNIPPEEAAVLWSEFTQKYNDKVELFFRFMYKDFIFFQC